MNQHHQAQWDKVVPVKKINSEDGPEGGAVLLVPRFRWGPLARWLQPRLRKPHIRVNLDGFGSFVWNSIDGKKNYNEILDAMRHEFSEALDKPEERLQKFFLILKKNEFVELYKKEESISELK